MYTFIVNMVYAINPQFPTFSSDSEMNQVYNLIKLLTIGKSSPKNSTAK